MSRDVDPRFAPGELLFRSISRGHLKGTSVKANALKLQISVAREAHETAEQVQRRALAGRFPQFNGVAQITVRQARGCEHGAVRVACIDEPTREINAHALIALWTEASPDSDIEEAVEKVRTLLARELTLVLAPK